MISVIIPLFNKEQYIKATILSVLNQSFQNFEIIVINDGSTDLSVEIIKDINDSRIRVINQVNSGVSIARNNGIKESRYNWVAFLDADDRWATSFLEEIYKAITTCTNSSIFVGCTTRIEYSNKFKYSNKFLPQANKFGKINLFKIISKYQFPINSSNSVIRKQHILNHGGFRSGQKNFEDHDLWIRLCINEPIVFVNKELSFVIREDLKSASTGLFLANDFKLLIQRFKEVESKLSLDDKRYFKIYYNKFILFTFINYREYYTPKELLLLKRLFKELLVFPYNILVQVTEVFNIKRSFIIRAQGIMKRVLP